MDFYKSKILGTGIYAPKKILTNKELESIVETSDEWIFERTGIRERRICSTEGGEWPTDMALYATRDALVEAKLTPNDIDLILFASVTPDVPLPNSASILQTKLGITNECGCLDISAACSGFVYGLNMANAMIQTGFLKNVLIVASEMLSREVDWKDRSSCILFGDGCGVAILGRNESNDGSQILSSNIHADGTGKEFFYQPYGRAVAPLTTQMIEEGSHYMKMKGKEMFKVATRTLAKNAKDALDKVHVSINDVNWIIPHQANVRIIETACKILGLNNLDNVIINIERWGNTSAATIPLAFHEAVKDGRIKRGDLVLFDTFGAGLTSGATLLRY